MPQQAPPIRAVQIIHAVLILGLVSITGMFVFLRLQEETKSEPELVNVLVIVAAVMFMTAMMVRPILGKRLLAQVAEDREAAMELVREDRVPGPLYTLSIVGAALVEAPGLLGAILLFLGGPWYVLAAPALSVCLIAMDMPTRTKLEEQVKGLAG